MGVKSGVCLCEGILWKRERERDFIAFGDDPSSSSTNTYNII